MLNYYRMPLSLSLSLSLSQDCKFSLCIFIPFIPRIPGTPFSKNGEVVVKKMLWVYVKSNVVSVYHLPWITLIYCEI